MPGNSQSLILDTSSQETEDLNVLELSGTKYLTLPASFSLANVRTLRLEDCYLGDLSAIGDISKLESLKLSRSMFENIPESFKRLTNLKLLYLKNCFQLRYISKDVISSFVNLEELDMWHSFTKWGENNVLVKELDALSKLTNLVINIPLVDGLSLKPFEKLDHFIIMVGISLLDFYSMSAGIENCTTRMGLSGNMSSVPRHHWVKYLLKRSESLCLYEITGVENVQGDLLAGKELTNLKFLNLCCCSGIKYLLSESAEYGIFNNLETLRISYNPNFVEICQGPKLPATSLSELKCLVVTNCEKISNIAPHHLLQRFQKLECCEVRYCKSLSHVFDLGGPVNVNTETEFVSSLKLIKLCDLPEMTCIWNWKGSNRSLCLGSLASVDVDCCDKLENLFTTSMAKSMELLKTLRVSLCSNMKEIMIGKNDEKGTSAETERIVFRNLYSMELMALCSLTCFCSGKFVIEFPALETLSVAECPKMKTFVEGDQVTPKLKQVNLQGKYQWAGSLNDTVKQFFDEQITSNDRAIFLEKIPKEGAMKPTENTTAEN